MMTSRHNDDFFKNTYLSGPNRAQQMNGPNRVPTGHGAEQMNGPILMLNGPKSEIMFYGPRSEEWSNGSRSAGWLHGPL